MIEGVKELRLSWSQLRHFDECRQKAFLMRTGKKPKDSNIRMFFPGTVVDRACRDYLNDEERAPGSMAKNIKMVMEREERIALENDDGVVKWKSRADRIEVEEFCVELVRRLEPILEDLVLPNDFEPSKRFKVPVAIPYIDGRQTTITLVGEYDILVNLTNSENSPKPWEIWDLKATKNDQYWRTTISQLVFYDLCNYLMFKQYTRRVGLIQPMCQQQVIAFEISDQQRVEMMQRIVAMAHSIWRANAFAGTPAGDAEIAVRPDTKHCWMCAVKNSCYRFKPVNGRMSLGIGALDNIAPIDNSEKDALLEGLFEV